MKLLVDLISEQVSAAFAEAGFDASYGRTTLSNRPDLCEFQCNGALPAAKVYHQPPMAIAEAVAEKLRGGAMFASVEAVKPGFLNLTLAGDSLTAYLARMVREPNFGVSPDPRPRTVVLDYGGPNVAKPLHVGHLRSAIIGESIKRIYRFFGNKVVGDIHMSVMRMES